MALKTCCVEGCNKNVVAKNVCNTHYKQLRKVGYDGLMSIRHRKPSGMGHVNHDGYIRKNVKGKQIFEHVLIAEKVLRKKLPLKAEIHHIDDNRQNNDPTNLVICPDHAYHLMLERRERAYNACGNADWRKCPYCKTYDDPTNMKSSRYSFFHIECARASSKSRRLKIKEIGHN